MTYVDVQYISVARKNEVQHHERAMKELQDKITQLNKAVVWELEQHHTRLKELQQAEDILALDDSPVSPRTIQPTLDPIPSTKRGWTKSRKYLHRSAQKPAAQLV